METKIVQDLISFYQAYHHTDVLKLIEKGVDLRNSKYSKINTTKFIYQTNWKSRYRCYVYILILFFLISRKVLL